ncbi:hypothetical protein N0V90_010915 [Kalmusia sp. IMI 367209]|nr:hypothetical protein N0V90_010915 [Kalmusia sp. IMI 367209]
MMIKRSRFEKRVREDAQTWKDRLIGKRIVTSDPHIAAHEGWKSTDYLTHWEPRVYFSRPSGEGLDQHLRYDAQPHSALLRLPAELRLRILEFVLPPEMILQKTDVDGMELGDAEWLNTSAIIFTCKQLYIEGRALALEKHTFSYERFSRKTRFCAGGTNEGYIWDLLNVICDTKTNVIKQALYG